MMMRVLDHYDDRLSASMRAQLYVKSVFSSVELALSTLQSQVVSDGV